MAFLDNLRSLSSGFASQFGHPTQVCTQVQLATSCVRLRYHSPDVHILQIVNALISPELTQIFENWKRHLKSFVKFFMIGLNCNG